MQTEMKEQKRTESQKNGCETKAQGTSEVCWNWNRQWNSEFIPLLEISYHLLYPRSLWVSNV